jgi:hypothetical protein
MDEERIPCPYKDSAFRQQELPAARPFLTPLVGCIVYATLALLSVAFGGAAFHLSERLFERELRYDEQCGSDPTCVLTLDVPSDVDGPIFVYYRLTKLYQSLFLYSASKDWDQLRGKPYAGTAALDSCKPLVTDAEKRPYVPCGVLPHSIFNDSFEFPPEFPELGYNETAQAKFQSLFKPPDASYDAAGAAWLDARLFPAGQTDDRFVTWMEVAAFPEFRKLWALTGADAVLSAGQYNITVENNFPVAPFGGTKSLVVAQVCWIGGQNPFFGMAFLVVAAVSFVVCAVLGGLHAGRVLPLYKAFEAHDGAGVRLHDVVRKGLLDE